MCLQADRGGGTTKPGGKPPPEGGGGAGSKNEDDKLVEIAVQGRARVPPFRPPERNLVESVRYVGSEEPELVTRARLAGQ
eukprot:374519-Lingulodinium_polyedra.AAC.1